MRSLLLLLVLFSSIYAQVGTEGNISEVLPEQGDANATEVVQKILYLNYADMPKRVFKGQVFPVTLKVLSTIGEIEALEYDFSKARGVELLSMEPERVINGRYTYDTFYFIAKSQWLQTPVINASLTSERYQVSDVASLPGIPLDVVTLNPTKHFANVIAQDLNVTDQKTTSYDQKSNILVFNAEASRSALGDFHLNAFQKQGAESLVVEPGLSTMTYYAIIPKKLDKLVFTYFQLESEKFRKITIPIVVDDDTVSTQSDLRPTEYKHKLLKIMIAGGIALIGLILLLLHKRLYYLFLIVLPGIYIAYAAVPITHACIKTGVPIYLLPMTNGTIFEMTTQRQTLEVEGDIKGYVKVKLENNKIGWIKNEDLCTP